MRPVRWPAPWGRVVSTTNTHVALLELTVAAHGLPSLQYTPRLREVERVLSCCPLADCIL